MSHPLSGMSIAQLRLLRALPRHTRRYRPLWMVCADAEMNPAARRTVEILEKRGLVQVMRPDDGWHGWWELRLSPDGRRAQDLARR